MTFFPPSKSKKFRSGMYAPINPSKYAGDPNKIVWRSSWELKFMQWCDMNPSVLLWVSESLPIPYYSQADGRWRRYFVDFAVKRVMEDGTVSNCLVEIKPSAQTKPPRKTAKKSAARYLAECVTYQVNQDKWEAARRFAKENGFDTFQILTEYDLGIKKRTTRKKPKVV